MSAHGAGEFLQRIDLRAHRFGAPLVEKFSCPYRGFVFPELLELFLEQVGPDALQIVPKEIAEPQLLGVGQVLWPFEQAPAGFLQDRFVAVLSHAPRLVSANLIEGEVCLGDDMEAIEDIQCAGAVPGDQLEIGPPHVRAHELDLLRQHRSDHLKELCEALFRAVLADPEQTGTAGLDLVYQRQVVVAPAIGDFVDTNGPDLIEAAMGKPPLDDVLHGIVDLLPAGMKAAGRLLPRELSGPVRQVHHVGLGQGVLADAPGDLFDFDAALATLDAPHAVVERDRISPDRDEFKMSLRQLIVASGRFVAARAPRPGTGPRSDIDLDGPGLFVQAGRAIDKPWKPMAGIE